MTVCAGRKRLLGFSAAGVGLPIAGLLGFSAAGPVAGSLAAGAQAYVGNVAAGSVFAAVQALAMAAPTP